MDVTEFTIPLNPEDLENNEGSDRYSIENVSDIKNLSASEIYHLMDEVERSLKNDKAFSIVHHENFDVLYSFASQFSTLDDAARVRLVDVVCAGLTNLVESITCILFQNSYVLTFVFDLLTQLKRGRR
jgi:hypothetical protein